MWTTAAADRAFTYRDEFTVGLRPWLGSSDMPSDRLARLAELLRRRNEIDAELAAVIGRPALSGHIGELIAGEVFDIELHVSATHKGSDGVFRSGPLAGRSVNVKLYGCQESILDMKPADPPDLYLVLTGEKRTAASSRATHRPVVLRHAYIFAHANLVSAGVRPGVAASVRQQLWTEAEVWPERGAAALVDLSPDQVALLELFR